MIAVASDDGRGYMGTTNRRRTQTGFGRLSFELRLGVALLVLHQILDEWFTFWPLGMF